MLASVPADVLDIILSYLRTSDLARVDAVQPVPNEAWTLAIRHRCGPSWPSGRAGVIRLYTAIMGIPRSYGYPVYGTHAAVCQHTACVVECQGGMHVWHGSSHRYYDCGAGRVACASVLNDTSVVVGNEYGLMVYPQREQLWSVAGVISVACQLDGSIWFTTADQVAYKYTSGQITQLPCTLALCVSAPFALVGTMRGTYPTRSINMPCCRIEQSATLAAAWHTDGSICTFRNGRINYVLPTGVRTAGAPLSVIGDVVCVNGVAWIDGRPRYICPGYSKKCTWDGTHVLTLLGCGAVGIT